MGRRTSSARPRWCTVATTSEPTTFPVALTDCSFSFAMIELEARDHAGGILLDALQVLDLEADGGAAEGAVDHHLGIHAVAAQAAGMAAHRAMHAHRRLAGH